MAITLGSNVTSLQAQRQLFQTDQRLGTVFERLSSGQRINRASDDAAGLAISESLSTDRRVFNQGVRNLNDGISLLNIADSTVEELSGIVIRIQELAEQAANGSLSSTQRNSLNTEAQELRDEFFRVSRAAEFNGTRLFDGSIENGVRLQAGYGIDGSIFSSLGGELGSGEFTVSQQLDGSGASSSEIQSIDVNLDGNIDLVSAGTSGGSGEILINLGNGDGTFRSGTTYTLSAVSGITLQIVDVNNDNILDIVTAGDDGGTGTIVSVLQGQSGGTFAAATSFAVGNVDLDSITLSDINGDGFLDLGVSGDDASDNGVVAVLLGNGDASFSSQTNFSTDIRRTFDVEFADINNDGVKDLVTAGTEAFTTGTVTISLGNGDGTFGSSVSYVVSDQRAESLVVADLNDDGNLDIVAGGYDDPDGKVSILINDGTGSFGTAVSYIVNDDAAGNVDGIELADVNGDGQLDIVAVGREGAGSTSGITTLLGDGTGSFAAQPPTTITNGDTLRFVTLNDFNGDGVLDLASVRNDIFVALGATREGINPILEFSLDTQAGALQALAPLENKLQSLSEQRGIIGAFQSRLQSALNTLGATSENYASAESRIRDADIAFESSQLTRLSILQQAAAAVLGQANQHRIGT